MSSKINMLICNRIGLIQIIKLALFCGSTLGVLTLVVKIVLTILEKIKQFFIERTLEIEWFTYIDITVVCLCMASIFYWFQLFILTK